MASRSAEAVRICAGASQVPPKQLPNPRSPVPVPFDIGPLAITERERTRVSGPGAAYVKIWGFMVSGFRTRVFGFRNLEFIKGLRLMGLRD